jgi:hypothetical protein
MKITDDKLSRRGLAGLASAAVLAAVTLQNAAQAQAPGEPDWFRQARESKRRAAEDLAGVQLPPGTEPAFRFRA